MTFKEDKIENGIKISFIEKPEIYGEIIKVYSSTRKNEIYDIKYFFNNIYQNTKHEDEFEKAKETLKEILISIYKNEVISFNKF